MKPSTKQKNTTGSLITKVDSVKQIFPKLDDKTVTVYDAYQKETKLGDLKNNKENNELTEILGVWSALVGYDAKPEELILIQKVIKNRFRTFTIEDIKYASELATEGKFKTRYKGSFSALYVQSSLAEYKEVRGNIVVTINERIKAIEKCQSLPVPDTEETVESYRFLIHNAYDNQKDIKKEDDYIDLGDVLYNFIKYNKLIKLTKQDIDDATAYAKKNIVEKVKSENYSAVINDGHIQKRNITEAKVVTQQKRYVVIKWVNSFKDKKELTKFTDSITPEMISWIPKK